MTYDAAKQWVDLYAKDAEMAYPAEGVIRIFKGRFPLLRMDRPVAGNSILDVGCGDGRHLPLFHSLGMKPAAVEISDEITSLLRKRMEEIGVPADLQTGTAASLPFATASFDYLLTWNSCYYMSATDKDFGGHVRELARVIRPGGWIVASVPKKTSFIFKDSSADTKPGYRIVQDDYFGMRNGEVLRCFEDRTDVEASFGGEFENFCHADLDMDWFGLSYRWHVFVAQRSGISAGES